MVDYTFVGALDEQSTITRVSQLDTFCEKFKVNYEECFTLEQMMLNFTEYVYL